MVEKNKCQKCEMAKPKKLPKGQASGTPQPKKGKPPKPGKTFGAVAMRVPAATPSCKRGKICPKTGYSGCKCNRSQGKGSGCKN